MTWISEDATLLDTLAAITALAAAVLGLLVGATQFSITASAHRTLNWTGPAMTNERDVSRRVALERLQLSAQAHLVAAKVVPWWRFISPVSWLLFTPVFVALIARNENSAANLAVAIGATFLNLSFVCRRGIRVYAARVRSYRQYMEDGVTLDWPTLDIVAQMEGGTRKELWHGFSVASLVTVTSVAAAWSIQSERSWIAPALAVGAAFATVIALQAVHKYAQDWAKQQVARQL